jgi:hypothetical protein
MTQVHSSGGAQAPFATAVSKGKAKAASQTDKKIAVPKAAEAKPVATAAKVGTEVTFGEQALHALESTGEFVGKALLTGAEDVGEAAYYTVKTLGTGAVDVAKGLGNAVVDGVHGLIAGVEDTATAVGHGVVNVEHALGDMWSLATQGATAATNLATALGTDAQVVAADLSVAATDVGVSAKALLAGVGSIASTAANYGTYVVKQTGKAISELT